MNEQRVVDLVKGDWKYMIVLDACRYDYFEKIHSNYLKGSLSKAVSPASYTGGWLSTLWSGKMHSDIVYVSSSPFVNSKGLKTGSFKACRHFGRIYDVWDWGWDDKLCTVHPSKVSDAAIKAAGENPGKRMIIHYMQPHEPYMSLGPQNENFSEQTGNMGILMKLKGMIPIKFRRLVGESIVNIFGYRFYELIFRIWNRLGIAVPYGETMSRKYGKEAVLEAYRKNTEIALEHAKKMSEKLPPGKMVVTSDHGELLGEKGLYGHPPHIFIPEIQLNVPWFEVSR